MQKAKILVVEDQKIIALEINERLSDMGYSVVGSAVSGKQAIQLATDLVPDLILMDIKLEGSMDGIEAAEKIRNLIGCPVIFLTAYADDKTIQRAKITEPYGYIVKPLDERELRSAIEIGLYKSRMERKLKDSELKYKSIVKSLEGLLYIVDSDFNIIVHNKTEEGLRNPENKKCYNYLYNINKPCSHCPMDKLQQGITTRIEFNDKNSGRTFYRVSTPVSLITEDGYFQHYLVDISERKKNEDAVIDIIHEKEILLKEIHHRVKNNLQLMLSLIRLQYLKASDDNLKSNLKVIESRLKSMAVIHDDLYSSTELTKIQLNNYLKKIIDNIIKLNHDLGHNIEVFYEVDNCLISVDKAIPLSLIINEIITNSFKYAFDGKSKCVINVKFKKNTENSILEISDNGTGFSEDISLEQSKGLGFQIIRTLAKQLDSVSEIFNDNGSHYRFIFSKL